MLLSRSEHESTELREAHVLVQEVVGLFLKSSIGARDDKRVWTLGSPQSICFHNRRRLRTYTVYAITLTANANTPRAAWMFLFNPCG